VPAPAPPPPPPPPPPRINNPDPRIQAWVAKIRLTGIRPGERPRVLMNDRVYLIGDFVSVEFNLRLKAIQPRSLEFADAEGNTYELYF
jgi:hypothetical protein